MSIGNSLQTYDDEIIAELYAFEPGFVNMNIVENISMLYQASKSLNGMTTETLGYFTVKAQAVEQVKRQGNNGAMDGIVTPRHAILFPDSTAYILANPNRVEININSAELLAKKRATAIAKLSMEERKILGLNE